MHNYYLSSVFDETWLARCGVLCGAVLLVVMMGLTWLMNRWLCMGLYLVAAPLVGVLLAGWDRRVTARMQSRRDLPSCSRCTTC